jgi:hypothetical protein
MTYSKHPHDSVSTHHMAASIDFYGATSYPSHTMMFVMRTTESINHAQQCVTHINHTHDVTVLYRLPHGGNLTAPACTSCSPRLDWFRKI